MSGFDCNTILIVANSGRMLAQLANNIALNSIVIDCFCDVDTLLLTTDAIKIESLALKYLKPAILNLNKIHSIKYVIYGSGFESYSISLQYLQDHFQVLGNSQSVFLATQNKINFFATLKTLQIPYPPVSFEAPKTTEEWLLKPMQGQGGVAIRKYQQTCVSANPCYWQRYIEGAAMSCLFVTNGSQVIIYGFHKQQHICIDEDEFVFSSIISQADMEDEIVQTVSLWIKKIVSAFTLKGMNSLDFMLKEDKLYVLEVNPRPTASMQFYANNILNEHIQCFLGGALSKTSKINSYQAYKIVFAEAEYIIKEHLSWPEWAADIPRSGAKIHTAMPICSIIAGDKNERNVEDSLLSRQQIIYRLLK